MVQWLNKIISLHGVSCLWYFIFVSSRLVNKLSFLELKKKFKGLTPKTLAVIVDEDLMNLHLLKSLTDFTNLKDKITIGQMIILQTICSEVIISFLII